MSEEDTQDGAPPGDGSQEDKAKWKPPSDGSWLPKKRVDEMVSQARGEAAQQAAEAARLRAENEALKAKPKEDAPKQWSRAELNALVADGKITQDAADATIDRQVREAAERAGRTAAAAEVAQRERAGLIARQLKDYRELVPSAWEAGSKERAKVEREYNALIELGQAPNQATEVAALRAALGDPADIRASRATGRNGPGESHEEIGGGERPGDGSKDTGEGPPKDITPRQKAHYESMISKGHYKDWKAVRAELKHARPR